MKTYTLEEASKTSLEALFIEASGDESIVLVNGDKRVMLTSCHSQTVDDPYTEEELAVFRAFEAESLRCSEIAAREMLAE